ncbi:UDP-N-acetylmuramate--L-alanine ligase [Maledivibacter halophilus]|uniref:UDP-N-acetylmuramate--L-alanine ligase n=1 Tax=Maledivibacter halophilus TaxID=36842 RepID=A0A1T5MSL3_9FIRM|nr:UDP-N-acetylmuramate--L-alanine ligase [Maledivibacter halophilus]SKC91220.1 UDP-N-acetylmuramate--L-alanine ligase [Maledivibacter halophilus]
MLDFLNKKKVNNIHLIGVGGIGMSALAEIILNKGFNVSGSDIKSSNITKKLENKGVKIYIGHHEDNIVDSDIIVYTSAVKFDNPEIIKAKKLNIPIIDRAEMLGRLMQDYKTSIAIAGAHGKTTTTSMISLILEHAKFDPTILVGGELDEIGGNVKVGNNDLLITEACEYKENFLKFNPNIGVVLNVDEDHLDYFKDLEHILITFSKFVKLIPKKGHIILNNDDYNVKRLMTHANCNVITYGINLESNFQATNITFNEAGYPSFNVNYNGTLLERFTLSVPGKHNIYNALASIATAYILEVPIEKIKEKLNQFKGTHRRFDILGEWNGIRVIDDYAHHPTEIKATLNATKRLPHNKIWCVFQPHTYTRTKALLLDFVKSFKEADKILITDIYAAREKDTGEIHSKSLVELIQKEGDDAVYIESFESAVEYLKKHANPKDIILTMGAGNINEVGKMLVNKSE